MPFALGGSLDYSYSAVDSDETTSVQQIETVNLVAATYIWQPWFADLSGRLGLSHVAGESNFSGSEGFTVTGDTRLRLFPKSRFPIEAYYNAVDSRVSRDVAVGVDDEFRTENFGILGRYRPVTGKYHLNSSWEHTAAQVGDDQVDSDRLALNVATTAGEHQFSLASAWSTEYGWDEDERVEREVFSSSLTHSRTTETWSTENGLGLVLDDDDGEGIDEQEWSLTHNSNWRSPESPLTVTLLGSLRGREHRFRGDSNSALNSWFGATAGYKLSEGLRAFGSVNYLRNVGDDDDRWSVTPRLGLNYGSARTTWGPFGYSWSAAAGANADISSDERAAGINLTGGHGISYSVALGTLGTALSVDLHQGVHYDHTRRDEEEQMVGVTHSLAVDLRQPLERGSVGLRMQAYDTRNYGTPELVTQTVNVSADFVRPIDRFRDLNLTYSMAATRSYIGADEALDTEEENFGHEYSSLNASYSDRRFFGMNRLLFQSVIEGRSDTPSPWKSEPRGDGSIGWTNRLSYTIGLTSLTASIRVDRPTDDRGGDTRSAFFKIIRAF